MDEQKITIPEFISALREADKLGYKRGVHSYKRLRKNGKMCHCAVGAVLDMKGLIPSTVVLKKPSEVGQPDLDDKFDGVLDPASYDIIWTISRRILPSHAAMEIEIINDSAPEGATFNDVADLCEKNLEERMARCAP